jgi:hypothetical protein
MWYYLRGKLIFFPFIGFLSFLVNRMLCLLFPKRMWEKYNTVHLKHKI